MALNSFGQVIPVTGPNNGFAGDPSRMGDRQGMSKIVDTTASAAGIPFGAGIVEISNATGGSFISFADYLATAVVAANLGTFQQQFAGIAQRNVQTQYSYLTLFPNGTLTSSTTATQATVGSTTIVVASAAGAAVLVGSAVEGAGLSAGTLVTGISGTTITISLATTAAIPALTPVVFSQTVPQGVTGYFAVGQQADCFIDGSIRVVIGTGNGTPAANAPVYVRVLANANLPGTAIGDFEAGDDVATTTPTTSTTVGSTTLTTSTGTGVAIGQRVTAPGIPANTYITAGSSTTWTISQAATATTTTAAASFSNMALLGDTINPWIRFRTGKLDQNNVAEVTILVRHAA
jgi:hypothetical protein